MRVRSQAVFAMADDWFKTRGVDGAGQGINVLFFAAEPQRGSHFFCKVTPPATGWRRRDGSVIRTPAATLLLNAKVARAGGR